MTAPAPAAVNVPGVGPVRRSIVVVGGVVLVAVVGYAYVKRRNTGTPVVGYETTTGTADAGTGGYQNPAPTSPQSGTVTDSGTPDITSNAEWSAAAVNALTQVGMDPGYVSRILGRYLDEQTLTLVEADVVRQAYAVVGFPPHPVTIKVQPTSNNPPPADSPPPAADLPAQATAPANVNLYDWTHTIEAQYGLPRDSVFTGKLRPQKGQYLHWGSPQAWGTDPRYGNIPYFTSPQTITIK